MMYSRLTKHDVVLVSCTFDNNLFKALIRETSAVKSHDLYVLNVSCERSYKTTKKDV